jgi:hypothetical protein
MKRSALVCVSVLGVILLGAAAAAAGDLDPTGVWLVTRSNSKTVGPCPMGGNGSGELRIEESGTGSSTYVHPEGFSCTWTFDIALSR